MHPRVRRPPSRTLSGMATSVRARGRQVTAVQAVALLLAFVLTAGAGGLLTAGLVLPGVAIANGATDLSVQAFDDLPTELQPGQLSEKSTMYAADGSVLAIFFSENRVVVPLDSVAPIMQSAVIATEDKRFYQHGGIDPTGMLRAAVQSAVGNKQGASTLTQQYIKNVLIEKASREGDLAAAQAAKVNDGAEGLARKLREAKLAIALEKTTTKDVILENYLNIAQFGINTFGVESAAQRYFRKSAADLNYLEAATIAGITQSPTALDPVNDPAASEKRRNIVLQLMRDQEYITPDEYTAGVATPIADTLDVNEPTIGCQTASSVIAGSGYFCDYVTKVIVNDPAFGATETERKDLLYRGGLKIYTTLDPAQQTAADTEVKAGIPVDDSSGVASAISVVEPGTGKITAMAQNRNYNTAADGGPRDTSVNFNTDQAYGGSQGFAPGSTFKPFTLMEWLKQGHSLSEQVNGSVRPLNENMFTTCGQKGPNVVWKPGNSEPGSGLMSVADATKNSVNLAYLTMAMQLDMCNIMNGAQALGVHTAAGGTLGTNPSNVIGTDSIAPLTMAAAFATFASGGIYCAPIAITSVQDANGEEIKIPSAGCQPVLEPRIANAVNYALSNVWKGTAKSVGAPGFTSAGKTGTTSHNEDTWFVGYTPLLAAAVWVGYSERPTPVQGLPVNGQWVNYMYGSTVAAPTWKRFMTQAMAGRDVPAFTAPGNDEVLGKQIPVPSVVGQPEATARATLEAAGFTATTDPTPVQSDISAGSVVSQAPSGTATAGSAITLVLSSGPPPVVIQPPSGDQGGGNQGGGDQRGPNPPDQNG